MRTILVDDEQWAIDQFELECREINYIEIVGKFTEAEEALLFAKENPIDFAVLDVEMPVMNGIELGKQLKQQYPKMILIYVTGYEKYIKEAILEVKADYYIVKPYSRADLEDIFTRALGLSVRQKKRVIVKTFGSFDVFVDGNLLTFTNAKAKELFALCVDHLGGAVSMEKAITILWEDREYDSKVKGLYRKAVIYLHALFREVGLETVFESGRAVCHINKSEVTCDYFDYLEQSDRGEEKFDGQYLNEYSWAEITNAQLMMK